MSAEASGGIEVIATAIQVGVGLLFASASFGKFRGWHDFKGVLGAYELLPSFFVPAAAGAIVVAESVTAVALLAGWNTFVSSVLAAALLTVFAVAMSINLARGRRSIDCGCFRSVKQPLEWRLVVRNVGLAVAILGSSVFAMPIQEPQRWLQAMPAGVALFAIFTAMNAVWALDASRALAFRRS
jgi:hypothetical protein